MLFDAKVPPSVITVSSRATLAEVRFTAFANAPQLVVHGKVVSLSHDAIAEQAGGAVSSYYLARVELTPRGRRRWASVPAAGMQAEVLIKLAALAADLHAASADQANRCGDDRGMSMRCSAHSGSRPAGTSWRRTAAGLAVGLLSASLCAQGLVTPLTLTDAYDAAVRHDARYQIATKEQEAARQGVPLARAVAAAAGVSQCLDGQGGGHTRFGNSLDQSVEVPLDYESPQVSLNLRTPLFNYEALSRLRQATSAADGAEALLAARHIDLVNRLTAAYLEVLIQHEVRAMAAEDLRSLQAQAERAQAALHARRGHGAGGCHGRRIGGRTGPNRLVRSPGRRGVGAPGVAAHHRPGGRGAARCAGRLRRLSLPLPTLQAWIDQARQNSPLLRFRRLSLEAAGFGIERQRAGHYPRVDLVAGMARAAERVGGHAQPDDGAAVDRRAADCAHLQRRTVEAGIAQSTAERDRVEQELRAEQENLTLEVERLYRLAVQGAERLAANLHALDATRRGREGGRARPGHRAGHRRRLPPGAGASGAGPPGTIQARYEFLNQRSQLLVLSGWPSAQVLGEMARVLSVDATMKRSRSHECRSRNPRNQRWPARRAPVRCTSGDGDAGRRLTTGCGGGNDSEPAVTTMAASNARFSRAATLSIDGRNLRAGIVVDIEGGCENLTLVANGTDDLQQYTCDVLAVGEFKAHVHTTDGSSSGA